MKALLPAGFGLGGHIQTSLQGPQASANDETLHALRSGNDIETEMMLRALIISMQGAGHTIPNPAVGCLFARGNRVIAAGATERYGARHAERVAFEELSRQGESSEDLDAYVTLEPCSHHGKQPPCCELFSQSRVARLIVALEDPNPLVRGRGTRFVQGLGIPVITLEGPASLAARAWHLPFLVQQTLGRPYIAGKWAQTLDGALAEENGTSKWITGPEARAHGHWLRLKHDVTAIGLNTLRLDAPELTVRDCWRPNERQPHICIVDPLGHADPKDSHLRQALTKLARTTEHRRIALVCPKSHAEIIKTDLPPEVSVLGFEAKSTHTSFGRALQDFWAGSEFESWLGRKPQSIFVEGGATLLTLLIEADALDALHIFIAPMLLGGAARRVACSTHNSPNLSMAAHFDILSTSPIGNDMLIELVPKRIAETFFARG